MDKALLADLIGRDALVGLLWGAGGGALVGIVTRSPMAELLGRIAVGGIVAAAAAPYLAQSLLNIPTTSAAYPFICCSLGILAFQIVRTAVEQPEKIPLLGAFIGRLNIGKSSDPPGGAPAPPVPQQWVDQGTKAPLRLPNTLTVPNPWQ